MNPLELLNIIEHGLPGVSRPRQIVIVGAGMAGLVAAELLKRAGHRVTILEAQQRVGGRIYTARAGLAPGLWAEMGAIALPQNHQLTMAYLERLHLPTAALTVSNPSTYIYLQGRRVQRKEFDVGQFALGLHPHEMGQAPEDLLKGTFKPFFDLVQDKGEAGWEEILAHYDQFSLEGYLRYMGWSAGAIALVGILHNLESRMQSSLVSVLRQEYTTMFSSMVYLPDGSDTLPNAFLPFLGEDIKFGATVVAIENTAQEVTVVYDTLAGRFRETADYAIVTLPFSLLRQIEVMPPFSPRKRRAMQQLQYDSARTLALQCRTRFWETEEFIRGGSSVTDLSVRQLYYPQSGVADFENENGAGRWELRSKSSDFSAMPYYLQSEQKTEMQVALEDCGYPVPFSLAMPQMERRQTGRGVLLATQPGVPNAGADLPPEFVLRQAIATLHLLHPQLGQAFEVGLCHDWGSDPYAGGVAALPAAGTLSRFNDIVAPEGRVYFAGEHCSKWYHRSIQGAIESGIVAANGVHQAKFSDGHSLSQSYLEQIRHQIFQVADGYNPQTNPEFYRTLQSYFPDALPMSDYMAKTYQCLTACGFSDENTMGMISICRDEIADPLFVEVMRYWGKTFNCCSLAGFIMMGKTGLAAAMDHTPISENLRRFAFYAMPHIAISKDGEIGKIYRNGIQKVSHACGALEAIVRELASSCPRLEMDMQDIEQTIIRQKILSAINYGDKPDLIEITKLACQIISRDVEKLLDTLERSVFKYAVMTGIQIHGPMDTHWIYPQEFYVVGADLSQGKEVITVFHARDSVTYLTDH